VRASEDANLSQDDFADLAEMLAHVREDNLGVQFYEKAITGITQKPAE
jgi:hypothetical protein